MKESKVIESEKEEGFIDILYDLSVRSNSLSPSSFCSLSSPSSAQ
jgi:hypothetical protein